MIKLLPKTLRKRDTPNKRDLYFLANCLLLLIIFSLIIIYILNIIIKNNNKVKAQEIYYSNSINNSSTSNQTFSQTTKNNQADTTEEIISNLKNSLNTNDKNNPDAIITPNNYVEIINSCDSGYKGTCVRARSCPSLNCPVVLSLRNNIVLATDNQETSVDNINWTHIVFNEWRRYADRLPKDLYVSTEFLKPIQSYKAEYKDGAKVQNLTNKKIIVDLGEQKLSAYDGDELFMEVSISTGLDDLPTPRGTFHIYKKTPSRYMQGPLPGISDQYYDLPGVPWTMYFTYQGAAIHGAYWHNNFGEQWSHGCVNLRPEDAELLYDWADLGTTVIVRD